MPFTVSHAAAVLPFLRTPLPAAALVVGAMAPDLPYFLPLGIAREFSHSLLGLVTIDLVVGVLVLLAWWFALRAPVLDYSPGWLRNRMPEKHTGTALWMLAALIIGGLTHLALDTVTHEGSLDFVFPVLDERPVDGIPFSYSNIIHGVASIIGAGIIAWWVRRWIARTPRRYVAVTINEYERVITWIILGTIFGAVGIAAWLYGLTLGSHPLETHLLFMCFRWAASIAGVLALGACVTWHVRKKVGDRVAVHR